MERLIAWLPAPSAAGRAGAPGAWRLPARQRDPRAGRAARARGARLGALDARRSARRFHLSPDAVAHAAERHRRRHRLAGRPRSRGARHPVARAPMSTPMWRAPGSIRARICRSISPTISSASPRSSRASSAACATAPRPASIAPAKAAHGAAARRHGVGFAQAGGRAMKTLRARARRRRGARPRPYRGARGARRDGRAAGRDRRRLDRRADRRGLCGRPVAARRSAAT